MSESPAAICERFLTELGKGIPSDERVIVCYAKEATVQTDADGKKLNAGWWPEPWKPEKYIKTEQNAYVTISSSKKTQNSKGEWRYWRGEASFGHGLALMVDDIGNGAGSKGGLSVEAMSLVLPPTAVVETSPGNYQLWYFFDKPEPDMRRFKAFLVCFVQSVLSERGGDSTIRDVSRYGRMPIGINNKRLDSGALKYGEEFRVRLVHADYDLRYSIDDIATAFRFEVKEMFVNRTRSNEIDEAAQRREDQYWLDTAVNLLSAAKLGEGSNGRVTKNMSGKYRIRCPWGHEHTNGDPFGAYFRGYIPGADHDYVFGCAHDSCRKENRRTWASFVDAVVMPLIEADCAGASADHQWYDPTANHQYHV